MITLFSIRQLKMALESLGMLYLPSLVLPQTYVAAVCLGQDTYCM